MTAPCFPTPRQPLNPNLSGLSTSATLAIQQKCRDLAKTGRTVYRLGLGQSPFPVPELVVQGLRENAHQKDYLPVKGLPELRRTLAKHHQREFGISCDTENIIVGPGSKELMFLLQLAYDGEIIIPLPAWVSYLPQAQIFGHRINTIMTDFDSGWKVTAEQLDAIFSLDPDRPRLLILNYPSNPTGQSYTPSELDELTTVFRKYRVLVLSDEIYAKTSYLDDHVSLVTRYPEGTIFSGGLSKWCGAGGWRFGVFILPERTRMLTDAIATVASETFTSTSAPIQYAAISAFTDHPELDVYLARCRTILARLASQVMDLLGSNGIRVLPPDGGFYVFPDFEQYRKPLEAMGITTSRQLCSRLLADTGVAILPGSDFGRPEQELTARIAFIDFNGSDALNNYPDNNLIDEQYINRYCGKSLEAIQQIVEWLSRIYN